MRTSSLPMSFRPVRKLAGIGNVFLGTELVDIAEYDFEISTGHPAPRRLAAQWLASCPSEEISSLLRKTGTL
jgi:hypothetical protein